MESPGWLGSTSSVLRLAVNERRALSKYQPHSLKTVWDGWELAAVTNAAITLNDNFDVVVAFRGVGDLNAPGRHPYA